MADLPKLPPIPSSQPEELTGPSLLGHPRLRPLADLPDPPDRLFVAGTIPERMVGIVGTRRSDPGAERFAFELAKALGGHGIGVVSGGARGIDGAAHRGSLDAGAPTAAILATHPRWAYPKRHLSLFERVLETGALVGETDDHKPLKGYFLQRNRLIAALGEVLVVIQAPLRSGSLSTARVALTLGRPVFAVPASPWDPRGAGNRWLLENGATPCWGIGSLNEVLGLIPRQVAIEEALPPAVGEEAMRIWRELGASPRHADELAVAVGAPVAEVQRGLMELVVAGAAKPVAGSRFVRG